MQALDGGHGEKPQGRATPWGGSCLSFPTPVNAHHPVALIQITAVTDLPERALPRGRDPAPPWLGNVQGAEKEPFMGWLPLPPWTSPHPDPLTQPSTLVPPQSASSLAATSTWAFLGSPEAPGMGFIFPPALLPAERIHAGPARKSQASQQDPAWLSLISVE